MKCLLRNLYAGQEATVRTRNGTTDWFKIGKGVHQGCLFNLYAEYIMWNARLDEAQAGIKISRRNISNLRYANDITLMVQSEEELKNLLTKWKRRMFEVLMRIDLGRWHPVTKHVKCPKTGTVLHPEETCHVLLRNLGRFPFCSWWLRCAFSSKESLLLLLSRFSHVRLCATPYVAAHQAPPSLGFSRPRTLEWVAISFSSAWKWKVKVKSLSRVWLLATPWTAAYQAPPSMGFSRQEYWSGVPLPSPDRR